MATDLDVENQIGISSERQQPVLSVVEGNREISLHRPFDCALLRPG